MEQEQRETSQTWVWFHVGTSRYVRRYVTAEQQPNKYVKISHVGILDDEWHEQTGVPECSFAKQTTTGFSHFAEMNFKSHFVD